MAKFKYLKCIEWILKESRESVNVSDTFYLQGKQCTLEYCVTDWYETYNNLYLKCKEELQPPITITVLVTRHESEYADSYDEAKSSNSVRGRNEIIWSHEGSLRRYQLTIEVIIHTDTYKVDKCFQSGSYLNTDVPVESLSEDMSKFLDTSVDNDAEIKCGEHTVKAHKNILCARSDVFKAMLQSNMLEGRTGVVEIQDLDGSYIRDFVRYLYTGTMPEMTLKKAKGLYEAGDKYAVRSLMLRCSEYLQDNLSPENVLEYLALADAHSDDKLTDSAIKYCLEKEMYLDEKIWLPFCESYPKAAVKLYIVLHKNDKKKKGVNLGLLSLCN